MFSDKDYPDLISGINSPDDAAIWRVDDDRALVVTTDFFTPVVDEPFEYGSIAAANSLSDIYAMGGEPFLALNISAMPPQLPAEIITEILKGGAEKAKEAGVVIAGGHTIQDKEPKYGLVALGFVNPTQILHKGGMKPGDILYLSKPIGNGIIASAIKTDKINRDAVTPVIEWMQTLNRKAAQLAVKFGAKTATDITGFSLLGHGWEMASASGTGMQLFFDQIPMFSQAQFLAKAWCFPGGSFDNAEYFGSHVEFDVNLTQEDQLLLFDPQTSGGLLFALPEEAAPSCEVEARKQGIPIWQIGKATDTGIIEVICNY
jgi:selenide,water dikinase